MFLCVEFGGIARREFALETYQTHYFIIFKKRPTRWITRNLAFDNFRVRFGVFYIYDATQLKFDQCLIVLSVQMLGQTG